MKIYLLSLIVGIGVGALYSLVSVRSPAPPVWALVGLLGMLLGEQLMPLIKSQLFNIAPVPSSVADSQTVDCPTPSTATNDSQPAAAPINNLKPPE